MEDVIEYVIAMEDGNDFITENKDEADERFEQLKELDGAIDEMYSECIYDNEEYSRKFDVIRGMSYIDVEEE